MKVKTIDNLVRFSFGVGADDFHKVEKYAPEALAITDDNGNEKFRVFIQDFDGFSGSISNTGAIFININEKPVIWATVPTAIAEEKKQYVMDNYGIALANLKVVEKQIKDVLENVNNKIAGLEDVIEEI